MKHLISIHLGIAVLIFAVGYATTSMEPPRSVMREEVWSLLPVRSLQLENQYLTRLAKSNRWKVNPKFEDEDEDEDQGEGEAAVSGSFDISRLKLVGVILGDPAYALIEISNNVLDFKIGEIVLRETQARLVAIDKDSIRLSDAGREYKLSLYPDLENE